MIEKAIKYELITAIPTLTGAVYPTNAPKEADKPYLVYARVTTRKIKTLDGYTDKQALNFMFSVMASRYDEMVSLRSQVENLLLSLPGRAIGQDNVYIEDLDINNIDEQYEHELKVNRGIIDFTVYF